MRYSWLLIHVTKGIDWASRDDDEIKAVTNNRRTAEEWVAELKENGFEKRKMKRIRRV